MDKPAGWIDLIVPFCGDYVEANGWNEGELKRAKEQAQLLPFVDGGAVGGQNDPVRLERVAGSVTAAGLPGPPRHTAPEEASNEMTVSYHPRKVDRSCFSAR